MTDNGALIFARRKHFKRFPIISDRGGFSLIELLVVIVIIGVIAAIGTPQLLGMRTRSSVRSDARDIHSAYRQAQTEAVKRGYNACVDVDADASSYQIQIEDYFGTSYSAATPIVVGESTILPKKEIRAGNSINVSNLACFNSRGLTVRGGGIILISNPSLTMKVELTPSGHTKSTNL